MPRGVEMDIFAALARTKGDIKMAICQFFSPTGYWNNVGNSHFHFLGVSL